MTDINPITGDRITAKLRAKKKFDSNYDRIFRQKCEWEDEIVKEEHDKSLKKGRVDK